MAFENDLKKYWVGRSIGVVHNVDAGGGAAFPYSGTPVPIKEALWLDVQAQGGESNPMMVKLNAEKSSIKPNPGWNFCMLAMAGAQGVEAEARDDARLPPWDPTSPSVVKTYSNWVRYLSKMLKPTHETESIDTLLSRRRRLEGSAGFEVGDEVCWDLVQIFIVRNALQKPIESGSDWIAYKFSWLPGNQLSAQEGGGHGPPGRW